MLDRRAWLIGCSTLAFGLCAAQSEASDAYPARLVKLVVTGVPGSAIDLVTRALADGLSAALKQPFVVENRAGAGGNLGAEAVARAAPDGHTLLVSLDTTLTVNPSLYRNLPFDAEADFQPLAVLASSSTMLVVHPSIPVATVQEFVTFARKEAMPYAHGGNGTPGHLSMEYFRLLAGFQAIPVPYRGSAPLVSDLVAGQIKLGFVSTAGVIEHVRAGRLKGFAISARRRAALAPDVPTIAESGYPDFQLELYYPMLAPAHVPQPVAALLESEVVRVLKSADFQDRFHAQDIEFLVTTGAETRARLAADRVLWAKVVKAANMRVD
jgi:tripartite-type tricarboxylate transporter receptor subunit TctC